MKMTVPEIILIELTIVGLLIAANQHGKQKEGNHSFWVTFISVLIQLSLLYWAGLFRL